MDLPRLKIGNEDCKPVHILTRYGGTLLMGKSGTGKSTSIENWWWQDELYPVAKVLVEPSGFLASKAYAISKGKAIYCSIENPSVSINPMVGPYTPDQISETIAEAINQVIKICSPGNTALTVKMRDILDQTIKY
jgi:hypothetical protein